MEFIVKPVIGSIAYFQRLMTYGKIDENTPLNELYHRLFMNTVFQNGIDELFHKYYGSIDGNNFHDILDLYQEFIHNISMLLKRIEESETFQMKFEDSFEMELAIRNALRIEPVVVGTILNGEITFNENLESGKVYYIGTRYENGNNIICILDIKYMTNENDIIGYNILGKRCYWKIDTCISWLLSIYGLNNITVCKFIFDRERNQIVKCEYNGDQSNLDAIIKEYEECNLIPNPFIITSDLLMILKKECPPPIELQDVDKITDTILSEDMLIEYPKDSFTDSIIFLIKASNSPKTKEIFITIYRIGNDPTLFYVLKSAVDKGIKVQANIELYANGEGINYFWMQEFIKAGITVTTFHSGKDKVHAKIILVKQNDGRYVMQLSTGNYHRFTTSQYTDLSINTTDQYLGDALYLLFELFKYDESVQFPNNLLVSQYNMLNVLKGLIIREANKKENGFILMKCNYIDEEIIINALQDAARMGCHIEIICRGNCSWYPSQYLNKNVFVRSFIWNKLEHSRVYAFGRVNSDMYIGSADMNHHKLNHRIEVLGSVTHPNIRKSLIKYLERYINSDQCWSMINGTDNNPVYIEGVV